MYHQICLLLSIAVGIFALCVLVASRTRILARFAAPVQVSGPIATTTSASNTVLLGDASVSMPDATVSNRAVTVLSLAVNGKYKTACGDRRTECRVWRNSSDKLHDPTGLIKPDPFIFQCRGLNQAYMMHHCAHTCGACNLSSAAPIVNADVIRELPTRLPPETSSGKEFGAELLQRMSPFRGVIRTEIWPLMQRFFSKYAASFRIHLDNTCVKTKVSNPNRSCVFLIKQKRWDCVTTGTKPTNHSKAREVFRGGWSNPQCIGNSHRESIAMVSSTSENEWHQKFAAEAWLPAIIESSPWYTSDHREAHATLAVLWSACLREGPFQDTAGACLRLLRNQSEAYTLSSRYFFIFTGDYGVCDWKQRYRNVDYSRHHIIGSQPSTPTLFARERAFQALA